MGDLVDALRLRQPSVSEQLRILHRAGLVQRRSQGRQRLYRLEALGIKPVADWALAFSRFWDHKLDALAKYLADKQAKAEGRRP